MVTAVKTTTKPARNRQNSYKSKQDQATIATITPEMVARMGDKVGKGLTLEQALLLEPQYVDYELFGKVLRARPELSKIYKTHQAMFIEQALCKIEAGDTKDRRTGGLQWILERRYREQFGRHDSGVHITNNILNGVPVDMMGQLRDRANKLSRGAKLAIGAPATETYYARKKRERLAAREIIHAEPVVDVEEIKPAKA